MWDELMLRAGYPDYLAQGGDWGSLVTHALLVGDTRCRAGHINLPLVLPDEETVSSNDPAEQATLAAAMHYQEHESGYSRQQSDHQCCKRRKDRYVRRKLLVRPRVQTAGPQNRTWRSIRRSRPSFRMDR